MPIKNKYTSLILSIILLIINTSFIYSQTDSTQIIVVIDAGHGGNDPGNIIKKNKKNYQEKEINLKISQKLGTNLSKNPNIKVIYTRKTDQFISLDQRAELANINKADYFISIHCNYSSVSEVNGIEFHIFDNKTKISNSLAQEMENEFKNKLGRNTRGIFNKQDRGKNLYVLKHTTMPAVLIEVGFMSNTTELTYLLSDSGQTQIANALYKGFKNFLAGKK